MWAAKQGVAALETEWDNGKFDALQMDDIVSQLGEASRSPKDKAAVARSEGHFERALELAPVKHEATYQVPFLSHAAIEPMNATVHVQKDRCDIWVGTQVPTIAKGNAIAITKLPAEQVFIHNHHIGGGFGRRLDVDFINQAVLIAKWQLVGFIHGVMNTDNMALSGETIDYGPCAFMDTYDPATVFSSIDRYGRYAYANQPRMAAWNLARFAETLLPLLHKNVEDALELANNALTAFAEIYQINWLAGMRAKLGILNEEPEDESLINNLLSLMNKYHADYTKTNLS